mgnify:CR=1 FL=1
MDEKITSRENAKIKYACRLSSSAAFRRSEGRFLAEGRKLCPELARGAQLENLFYTEDAMARCPELADLPGEHYLVEDHVADKLADVGTHQGVFGVFRTPVHTLDEVHTGGRYLAAGRRQIFWQRDAVFWHWKRCRTPAMWARCCAVRPPLALTACC